MCKGFQEAVFLDFYSTDEKEIMKFEEFWLDCFKVFQIQGPSTSIVFIINHFKIC